MHSVPKNAKKLTGQGGQGKRFSKKTTGQGGQGKRFLKKKKKDRAGQAILEKQQQGRAGRAGRVGRASDSQIYAELSLSIPPSRAFNYIVYGLCYLQLLV